MKSMYEYLTENGLTDDEALETEIRWENGMEIPKEIRDKIDKYYELRRVELLK